MPFKHRRKAEDLLSAAGGGARPVGASLLRVLFHLQGHGDLELACLLLGIICERYDVTVVMNEIPFELPREQDKWLMQEFVCLGYAKKDLEWLNQVRLFQQVLFLSDILGASGSTLDKRYLCRH
jgi:hypothetical protein